jgi:hypothetical protein
MEPIIHQAAISSRSVLLSVFRNVLYDISSNILQDAINNQIINANKASHTNNNKNSDQLTISITQEIIQQVYDTTNHIGHSWYQKLFEAYEYDAAHVLLSILKHGRFLELNVPIHLECVFSKDVKDKYSSSSSSSSSENDDEEVFENDDILASNEMSSNIDDEIELFNSNQENDIVTSNRRHYNALTATRLIGLHDPCNLSNPMFEFYENDSTVESRDGEGQIDHRDEEHKPTSDTWIPLPSFLNNTVEDNNNKDVSSNTSLVHIPIPTILPSNQIQKLPSITSSSTNSNISYKTLFSYPSRHLTHSFLYNYHSLSSESNNQYQEFLKNQIQLIDSISSQPDSTFYDCSKTAESEKGPSSNSSSIIQNKNEWIYGWDIIQKASKRMIDRLYSQPTYKANRSNDKCGDIVKVIPKSVYEQMLRNKRISSNEDDTSIMNETDDRHCDDTNGLRAIGHNELSMIFPYKVKQQLEQKNKSTNRQNNNGNNNRVVKQQPKGVKRKYSTREASNLESELRWDFKHDVVDFLSQDEKKYLIEHMMHSEDDDGPERSSCHVLRGALKNVGSIHIWEQVKKGDWDGYMDDIPDDHDFTNLKENNYGQLNKLRRKAFRLAKKQRLSSVFPRCKEDSSDKKKFTKIIWTKPQQTSEQTSADGVDDAVIDEEEEDAERVMEIDLGECFLCMKPNSKGRKRMFTFRSLEISLLER